MNLKKQIVTLIFGVTVLSNIVMQTPLYAYAERDYNAEMEDRKYLPIESNQYENWPDGPAVGAKSAIVMEANTHTILYEKNIHEELYPASTTKILTCLIAAEQCSMDETVTFSKEAVYGVPSDGSNMGMDAGESITMEQALYGILVGSANEAASAVAEHISGSTSVFAELMNQRAGELGCTNSHFVNANGLFDENHYTSAYDLALIGCEFFSHDILCRMSSTSNYNIPPTASQPDDIWINSKNQLYAGKPHAYEYLVGSKTGFVSESRQTLVSCAEKDGMKLVCVVFMEESPYQFTDTIKLFDYGFQNFQMLNVASNETNYTTTVDDFFCANNDIFGNSTPIMNIDTNASIILPKNAVFSDAESSLSYDKSGTENIIATINYQYSGQSVGSANIIFSGNQATTYDFSSPAVSSEAIDDTEENNSIAKTIFIDITKIILFVIIFAGIIILLIFLYAFIKSYQFSPKGRSKNRRAKRKRQMRQAWLRSKRISRSQKSELQKIKNDKKKKKRRKKNMYTFSMKSRVPTNVQHKRH